MRVPAETLRRFWTMLAHHQGGLSNASELARSLGVSVPAVTRYVDLLADLMLVRRLPAYFANVGKRLVRRPKVYIRDSGVLHSLLGLGTLDDVLSHPVAGASWEGFVVENLIAAAPFGTDAWFYRTRAGAEIDLLLHLPDRRLWAIEIKRSSAPRAAKGFELAASDLGAAEAVRDLSRSRAVSAIRGHDRGPADGPDGAARSVRLNSAWGAPAGRRHVVVAAAGRSRARSGVPPPPVPPTPRWATTPQAFLAGLAFGNVRVA